jgi:uncharacterized protein YndB with AHSA1/START domain
MIKQFIMKYDHSAQVSVHIHAPVQAVWDALTKPEIIKKYFFGTNTITDWVPGHMIVFEGEWEGKTYHDKGTVLEFYKYEKLRYDYWSSMSGIEDKPENYAIITYELFAEADVTTLIVTQENISDEARKEHSIENWKMVLQDLKKLLESQPSAA